MKSDGKGSNEIPIYLNQEEFEKNLPKTVELLTTEDRHKVFVVGTIHFSLKSQDDVSVVVRNTKPKIILLELCPQRKYILEIDEDTLLREASTLDAEKIRHIIYEKGLVNGMFYISFLRTNANITKKLGVAPGGECRRAVTECKKLSTCRIVLGDRPIDVTMQRALKPLSVKQKLQLSNIFNDPSISKITEEEVEAYKDRDVDYLQNLRQRFPSVYRSFVSERDKILAHNLLLASKLAGETPSNIVGVVGIGHMNGILKNFGKTNTEDIKKIMVKDLGTPHLNANIFTRLLRLAAFLKYR